MANGQWAGIKVAVSYPGNAPTYFGPTLPEISNGVSFVDISDVLSPYCFATSTDFAQALLDEARVALTPGEAFEAPGFVRISYAASMETLREGSRRLLEFVSAHAPRTPVAGR